MRSLPITLAAALLLLAGCTGDTITSVENEDSFAGTLDEVAAKKVSVGTVTPLLWMTPGDSPEGIAFDKRGNIYVSNRRTTEAGRESEILKITPGGTVSVFAVLPSAAPEATGALGLTVDPSGNLYVAHVTGDPASHGVWRIRRNGGDMERLAGSQDMIFPNALTFDARGNLYVTDSFGGAVWRYGQDGTFTPWLQHPLLEAVPLPGAPIPVPGANGIAFFPPHTLYVANTSQFSVVRILIAPDGAASDVEVVAQGLGLVSIDGIVVDVQENIYGVLGASNAEELGTPINPVPPLVKVDPRSGVVTSIVDAVDFDFFDAPTSLAFGTSSMDRKQVFIANSALFGPVTNGPGPGMVKVSVGIPGCPDK